MIRNSLIFIIVFGASLIAVAEEGDKDAANRARFEKECSALIAPGGPCADVKKGGGGRRGCAAQPGNIEKASPACKEVIEDWKTLDKK